jgi:putative transposase
MKDNRLHYPVKLMARVLEVSRSGYYAWLVRKPSQRAGTDMELSPKIRKAHELSRRTYGPRRIQAELAAEGVKVGRDRIGRLRKKMRLICIQKRKFKATTDSKHDLPIEENLLNQQFTNLVPGQVWGSDITYIPTGEGWLYLAGVKDFGSKEIVGWAMGERMTKGLVRHALRKARAFRTPLSGCIHHSDRGSQYCSKEYRRDLQAAGFIVSMSRKGNCYDNAPTESLWGSLKQELIYHRTFATREEARAAVQEYIEVFYNRVRRHSAIGNVAPSRYAESFHQERVSA